MDYEKVTCFYCEFYKPYYTMDYPKYNYADCGNCVVKNISRKHTTRICDSFKIRSGLYTLKWYPGKE